MQLSSSSRSGHVRGGSAGVAARYPADSVSPTTSASHFAPPRDQLSSHSHHHGSQSRHSASNAANAPNMMASSYDSRRVAPELDLNNSTSLNMTGSLAAQQQQQQHQQQQQQQQRASLGMASREGTMPNGVLLGSMAGYLPASAVAMAKAAAAGPPPPSAPLNTNLQQPQSINSPRVHSKVRGEGTPIPLPPPHRRHPPQQPQQQQQQQQSRAAPDMTASQDLRSSRQSITVLSVTRDGHSGGAQEGTRPPSSASVNVEGSNSNLRMAPALPPRHASFNRVSAGGGSAGRPSGGPPPRVQRETITPIALTDTSLSTTASTLHQGVSGGGSNSALRQQQQQQPPSARRSTMAPPPPSGSNVSPRANTATPKQRAQAHRPSPAPAVPTSTDGRTASPSPATAGAPASSHRHAASPPAAVSSPRNGARTGDQMLVARPSRHNASTEANGAADMALAVVHQPRTNSGNHHNRGSGAVLHHRPSPAAVARHAAGGDAVSAGPATLQVSTTTLTKACKKVRYLLPDEQFDPDAPDPTDVGGLTKAEEEALLDPVNYSRAAEDVAGRYPMLLRRPSAQGGDLLRARRGSAGQLRDGSAHPTFLLDDGNRWARETNRPTVATTRDPSGTQLTRLPSPGILQKGGAAASRGASDAESFPAYQRVEDDDAGAATAGGYLLQRHVQQMATGKQLVEGTTFQPPAMSQRQRERRQRELQEDREKAAEAQQQQRQRSRSPSSHAKPALEDAPAPRRGPTDGLYEEIVRRTQQNKRAALPSAVLPPATGAIGGHASSPSAILPAPSSSPSAGYVPSTASTAGPPPPSSANRTGGAIPPHMQTRYALPPPVPATSRPPMAPAQPQPPAASAAAGAAAPGRRRGRQHPSSAEPTPLHRGSGLDPHTPREQQPPHRPPQRSSSQPYIAPDYHPYDEETPHGSEVAPSSSRDGYYTPDGYAVAAPAPQQRHYHQQPQQQQQPRRRPPPPAAAAAAEAYSHPPLPPSQQRQHQQQQGRPSISNGPAAAQRPLLPPPPPRPQQQQQNDSPPPRPRQTSSPAATLDYSESSTTPSSMPGYTSGRFSKYNPPGSAPPPPDLAAAAVEEPHSEVRRRPPAPNAAAAAYAVPSSTSSSQRRHRPPQQPHRGAPPSPHQQQQQQRYTPVEESRHPSNSPPQTERRALAPPPPRPQPQHTRTRSYGEEEAREEAHETWSEDEDYHPSQPQQHHARQPPPQPQRRQHQPQPQQRQPARQPQPSTSQHTRPPPPPPPQQQQRGAPVDVSPYDDDESVDYEQDVSADGRDSYDQHEPHQDNYTNEDVYADDGASGEEEAAIYDDNVTHRTEPAVPVASPYDDDNYTEEGEEGEYAVNDAAQEELYPSEEEGVMDDHPAYREERGHDPAAPSSRQQPRRAHQHHPHHSQNGRHSPVSEAYSEDPVTDAAGVRTPRRTSSAMVGTTAAAATAAVATESNAAPRSAEDSTNLHQNNSQPSNPVDQNSTNHNTNNNTSSGSAGAEVRRSLLEEYNNDEEASQATPRGSSSSRGPQSRLPPTQVQQQPQQQQQRQQRQRAPAPPAPSHAPVASQPAPQAPAPPLDDEAPASLVSYPSRADTQEDVREEEADNEYEEAPSEASCHTETQPVTVSERDIAEMEEEDDLVKKRPPVLVLGDEVYAPEDYADGVAEYDEEEGEYEEDVEEGDEAYWDGQQQEEDPQQGDVRYDDDVEDEEMY